MAIEGNVMGVPWSRAGGVTDGVAVLDAILHPALLPVSAAGCLAGHLLGLWVTDTTSCARAVAPELFIGGEEFPFKFTPTGGLGDAFSGVQHKTLIALAGFHTRQWGAVPGSCLVVAGSRTRTATGLVFAVLRAGKSCQRDQRILTGWPWANHYLLVEPHHSIIRWAENGKISCITSWAA